MKSKTKKYASTAPFPGRQGAKRPTIGWSKLEMYAAIRMEEAMTEETITVLVVGVARAVAVVVAKRWLCTWRGI